MKSLVITTAINNQLNPNLFHLLGAVTTFTAATDVLVVGHNLGDVAAQIAIYQSVSNVLTLDHKALSNLFPENMAIQLAEIISNYTHVLIAADSFGKNLLPRIAGILEMSQISEVVQITSPTTFKKFIYAGNVLIDVESSAPIKLLSISTTNFPENTQTKNEGLAPVTALSYNNPITDKIRLVATDDIAKQVDLTSAKIVVTGGIALGSQANFDQYIRVLAAKLNAGVGASRAAVEAGYATNDCQVGQTGKVVAPELYLAIGISGAVQHIAGMKNSKTVIAINNDRNAAIFEYADYGLVGDLFTIVPELLAKLS